MKPYGVLVVLLEFPYRTVSGVEVEGAGIVTDCNNVVILLKKKKRKYRKMSYNELIPSSITNSTNMPFQIGLDQSNAYNNYISITNSGPSQPAPLQLSICQTIVYQEEYYTYQTQTGQYVNNNNVPLPTSVAPSNFVCSLGQMAETTNQTNYYYSSSQIYQPFTSGTQNFTSEGFGVLGNNYFINTVAGYTYNNLGTNQSNGSPNASCVGGPMVSWNGSTFTILGNIYYCGNGTSDTDASQACKTSLVCLPNQYSYFQLTTKLPNKEGFFTTSCMLFPYINTSTGATQFGVADVLLTAPLSGNMFNNMYDSAEGWSGYFYVYICTDNEAVTTASNEGYNAFPQPTQANPVYPFLFDPASVVMSDTQTTSWARVGAWSQDIGNDSGIAAQMTVPVPPSNDGTNCIQYNNSLYFYGGYIPVNWGGNSNNPANQDNTYACMQTFNASGTANGSGTNANTPPTTNSPQQYQSSFFLIGSCQFGPEQNSTSQNFLPNFLFGDTNQFATTQLNAYSLSTSEVYNAEEVLSTAII